jgi:hypothetical protein
LRHLHPFIPKLGFIIGAADAVVLDMSESGFNGVGVPFPDSLAKVENVARKPWATTSSLA